MNNQEIDIKNLEFTSEDTGTIFSWTYSEYFWKFTLDGIQRAISLYHSRLLGRRTIYLGEREICRYQRYTYSFFYSFPIDTHTISIAQSDDTYILKIDDVPFNKLLNEQKLRRFNIIKDTFLEKEKTKRDRKRNEIRKFRTFNRNMVIPISRRTEDDPKYRTDIYSSKRDTDTDKDKDLDENLNINKENSIDTSTNKRSINDINNEQNNNQEFINPEQYYDEGYYYDAESSEELSNKAIDGGDSINDEDDDDINVVEDDRTIKESFRAPYDDELYNTNDNLDDNDIDFENNEELEEINQEEAKNNSEKIKENKNSINVIKEEDEEIFEDFKEDDEIKNYNEINNELEPIKSKKKKEKSKKKSKKDKGDKKKKKKNKEEIININNDNDNENNINNDNNNHIDLLGEEIYNSSRDKDLYINNNNFSSNFNNNNFNNNVDNNLNINYLLAQKQDYSGYKSTNPSNPFESASINTH